MKIADLGDQLSYLHMRRFNHAYSASKTRHHTDSRATLRVGSVPVTCETPRKRRKNKRVFAPITRYSDTTIWRKRTDFMSATAGKPSFWRVLCILSEPLPHDCWSGRHALRHVSFL